jgi:hypothetical protein
MKYAESSECTGNKRVARLASGDFGTAILALVVEEVWKEERICPG